jgi:tRNA1(Val) A37 N6-methylase TrmN6
VPSAPTTEDRLLGGRVTLAQPAQGYRVAIDPVLLAAATSAKPGETILDAGCGSGAAALCLAARLKNFTVTGVELNPDLALLARANIAANDMGERLSVVEASFAAFARTHEAAFDQVMTNPPFHEHGRHSASPHATKAIGHGEGELDLLGWVKVAAIALKPAGRLTLIHRADRVAEVLAALEGRFGAAAIYPLWPRAGAEAKRILVGAIKGRRTLPRILPGLVLHRGDGAYTDEAQAVLRDAAPLDLEMPSA